MQGDNSHWGTPPSWKEGDKFEGKSLQVNKAALLGSAAGGMDTLGAVLSRLSVAAAH